MFFFFKLYVLGYNTMSVCTHMCYQYRGHIFALYDDYCMRGNCHFKCLISQPLFNEAEKNLE